MIQVVSVVKRMPVAADDAQLEEERCRTLKATIDLHGEALALQSVLTSDVGADDESEKEELRNLLTEIAELKSQLKTEEGR